MAEQWTLNPLVLGSNPRGRTTKARSRVVSELRRQRTASAGTKTGTSDQRRCVRDTLMLVDLAIKVERQALAAGMVVGSWVSKQTLVTMTGGSLLCIASLAIASLSVGPCGTT